MAVTIADTARGRTRAKAKEKPAPIPGVQLGRRNFRFSLARSARRLSRLILDSWVESADWQRNTALPEGSLTFHTPLDEQQALVIATGDEIQCDVQLAPKAPWQSYWQMAVNSPQDQVKEGIQQVTLAHPGGMSLTGSKVAWSFHKSRARPYGWTADQITRNVCQRFHIPVGTIPKAYFEIDSLLETSTSPYDVIVAAWALERHATGRRYDIKYSNGLLTITELRHPDYMLALGPTIIDAILDRSIKGVASAVAATTSIRVPYTHQYSLHGHKHESHGHKSVKLRVQVVDPSRAARYGFIVKTLHAPAGISSTEALRNWAQQQLVTQFTPQQTVNITFPGIPYVDRGDSLHLKIPEADFDADVFIQTIDHSINAGTYVCSAQVGFTDPALLDQKQATALGVKGAAAAKRGRRNQRLPSLFGHTKPKAAPVRAKKP